MEVSGHLHILVTLCPGERNPSTYRIEDRVGPRVDLYALEKKKNFLPLPGIEPRFLGSPAHRLNTIPTNGY
jgi:hypothetical protein